MKNNQSSALKIIFAIMGAGILICLCIIINKNIVPDNWKEAVSENETVPVTEMNSEIPNSDLVSERDSGETILESDVELTAGFDEEFEIKEGEKLYIGNKDICIELNSIIYDETAGYSSFLYTMTIGDKVYDGDGGFSKEMGGSVNQNKFSKNVLSCVGANKNVSITLILTSEIEVKKPLNLSGNADDEYVTTQPEYVVSDDIILFLDKNVKVSGDVMEQIAIIKNLVEKEAGLKLKNNSIFADNRSNDISWLYGDMEFAGVDYEYEKFHIYVVPYEKCAACCMTYSIVLNPEDLDFAGGEGTVLVHEMAHAVHSTNGIYMCSVMDEGFATYITGQITEKDEIITFNFDADENYSYYPVAITEENAESEFLAEHEDKWDDYLYGYRFMTYLFETYGDDIFRKMLTDANTRTEISYTLSSSDLISIIKTNTSEDVFKDFAKWLSKQDRFNDHVE